MEFPINFKTITEAHLVLSRSQTQVPEITGIRTAFTGPHFRDHGNQDFILNITEAGSHFFNYGNRIKFLISRNWDCISDITGVGTAFPRSRDQVCISEIMETAL